MLYFLIFLLSPIIWADEDIYCTKSYCQTYLEENTCSDLPVKCQIQNLTHNGIFLPSSIECNCCDYCLENLDENAECANGKPGSPIPSSICGPGLTCNNGICTRMDSECHRQQDEYDEKRQDGTLGHMEVRPVCDDRGKFSTYKCIPGQTCYCLDEDNNRIFGEIDFTENAAFTLKCQCSRKYAEAVALIGRELGPHEFFRCAPNGDYDPLQCIDDQCFCVDALDGAPTYPDAPNVNLSSISPDTLPCFDPKRMEEGEFFSDCTQKHLETLQEIEAQKQNGYDLIFDMAPPNCDLSGKYGPVQETEYTKFCADPDGNLIENYSIEKTDEELIRNMNCKCARTARLTSSDEKPECCANGNFKTLQCRRGWCRCVDADGNQIEKELELDVAFELSCYDAPCLFD